MMPQHGADDVTSNKSYSCLRRRPIPHQQRLTPPTPNFFGCFHYPSLPPLWCHLPRIFAQGTSPAYAICTTSPSRSCLPGHIFGLIPCGMAPNHDKKSQLGINIHIYYMEYEWESPIFCILSPPNLDISADGSASPILTLLPSCLRMRSMGPN